jgi:hypothetical protein
MREIWIGRLPLEASLRIVDISVEMSVVATKTEGLPGRMQAGWPFLFDGYCVYPTVERYQCAHCCGD